MSDQGPHRQSLLLPVVIPLGALAVIALVLFGFSRILLGISHTAATVTACVVALVILVVAAVVAGQRRVGPAAIGSMLGVVTGVTLMTGSLAFLIVGPQPEEVEPVQVTLAAGPNAAAEGFAETSLAFPADTPVELEFENEEEGVQHNVDILRENPADSPDQTPLFNGQIITGPATTTYAVPPVPEGEYFFLCEVHPTTMQGTITASAGGAAPGPTVLARDLEFDTDRLELVAGTATGVNLDNQDAGILHNISIYTDDSLEESLFEGEQIQGPASTTYTVPPLDEGSYYFHCDVHPAMNGTVEVAAEGGGGGGGGGGDGQGGGSPPPAIPTQTEPPPGEGGGAPVEASISAEALTFSTDSLAFPADTPVSLTFDNQDPGAPHNVAIYRDEGYTDPVLQGEVITGPATVTYDVPPLPAAAYPFRCDVHPAMTGTVQVT